MRLARNGQLIDVRCEMPQCKKRMSLDEIAEQLNVEKVPTIHGTNRWTASSVRKAFVS